MPIRQILKENLIGLAILLPIFLCLMFGLAPLRRLFFSLIPKERVFEEVREGCVFIVHPKDDVPLNVFNIGTGAVRDSIELKVTNIVAVRPVIYLSLSPGDKELWGYTFRVRNHRLWIINKDGFRDPNDEIICN